MRKAIFIFILILMTLSCVGQINPAYPDPAPENNLFCHFNRPWFPQWESGMEVSNPGMGYRLDGSSIDMIIYGYNLDSNEQILVENRDSLGRLVSSGSIYTDKAGKFYLHIDTELPDSFLPNKFYSVYLTRENGYSVKAGVFYVGAGPPDDYHYTSWGNLLYGFSCDASGKPYLLSWLSYRNGPNILDNYEGRGREFQGDLIDGYLVAGSADFRYNTVNPTQGGGNYGKIFPDIIQSQIEPDYIWAKFKALDYSPNNSSWSGSYRKTLIQGRWPDCGWLMTTEYKLSPNDVTMSNRFWHTDNYNHRVHQIRTAQIFLNPLFFQNAPLNDNKRVQSSYLKAVIADERIEAYSDALGVKITFRAGVDGYDNYYSQRQWNYQDYLELAEPGKVQVWECLNVAEINKFIPRNQELSGWGKITITEADKLGIGFDMEKFKEYLRMIFEQRDYQGWK